MLISTELQKLGNWLKAETFADYGFGRVEVTVNDSAQTLATGTVLGKVTATGKYKVCTAAAADGSQNAAGIVITAKTIAGSTDTKVLTLVKGPAVVAQGGLVLAADIDTAPEKAAVYAALEALGIVALASI